MPNSRDRFAYQNRYDPPPGVNQASIWSGIVHRLSGLTRRTRYASTASRREAARVSLARDTSRMYSRLPCGACLPSGTYLARHSHLRGPCFKTGPACESLVTSPSASLAYPEVPLRCATHRLRNSSRNERRGSTARRLPPQRFRVLFHSLFRVLFSVPSRYELVLYRNRDVISLGWASPAAFGLRYKAGLLV